MTVRAVYQGGVLRPDQALPLRDGETVEIVVTPIHIPPPLTEEEAIRRIKEAKTIEEWIVAADAAAAFAPKEYDLLKALDENRRLAGDARMLFPDEDQGSKP